MITITHILFQGRSNKLIEKLSGDVGWFHRAKINQETRIREFGEIICIRTLLLHKRNLMNELFVPYGFNFHKNPVCIATAFVLANSEGLAAP